mmetsp:Transcript_59917/g.177665  ORF Transcript_59917/g.177665 Transcript_59917/m.177665 type:complete len:271 (-) Transcript_59917:1429-2241(-)
MLDTCRGTRPSDAARSTRSFMSASTRSAYVASSSSSSSSSSFESSSSSFFVLLLLLAAGDGFDVNIFSTSSRSSSNPNSLARTMRHRAVYSKDRSLTGSTSINPSSTASLTASLKVQRGVPSLWRRGRDSGEDRGGVVKSPSQSSSAAAAVAPPVPMGGAMRCNMYDHDTDNMPSTLCISSPLPNKSLMVLTIGSPPPTVTSLKYCADNFPRAHSARRTSRRNFRGPDRAVLFAVTTCTSESSQEGWSRPTRSSAVQSKITECATSSART